MKLLLNVWMWASYVRFELAKIKYLQNPYKLMDKTTLQILKQMKHAFFTLFFVLEFYEQKKTHNPYPNVHQHNLERSSKFLEFGHCALTIICDFDFVPNTSQRLETTRHPSAKNIPRNRTFLHENMIFTHRRLNIDHFIVFSPHKSPANRHQTQQ